MKLEYIEPEIDIVMLSPEDIIITSQIGDGGDQGDGDNLPGSDWDDIWGGNWG